MKVDPATTSLNGLASPVNANKQAPLRTNDNAIGVSTLPASLDSLSSHIQQLQTQLVQPSDADFDAAKVAEIRLAISEGRYQINTDKIADGLIDTVRDLLGKSTEASKSST